MEFILFLLIIVAVIFSWGYLRAVVKRLRMMGKLRRCCRTMGYTLTKTGSLLTLNRSDRVTLKIENNDTVYAVKLFGSVHKCETFYLTEGQPGFYTVDRIIPLVVGRGGSVAHTKTGRNRPLPEVDWYSISNEENQWKRFVAVALFCPAPMELRISNNAAPNAQLLGDAALDPYTAALKKRRLDDGRSHGGWASGGYSYRTASTPANSGSMVNGAYIYGTQDLIRELESKQSY